MTESLLSLFRVLLSYWYYKGSDLDILLAKTFPQGIPPLFADSGAFSAMTQGSSVDVHRYGQWLQRYQHFFTVYANLDVIRHPTLTWNHQQILEQEYGLTPLPVFHVATPWSWLDHYLERYPYIALGVAGHPAAHYMGWLVQCFQRAQGRVVFHGFGITSWQAWRLFPWYSVDSSSWGQGFRYGSVPIFVPHLGRFVKARLGDRAGVYRYAATLRSQGIDPELLVSRQATRAQICSWSARSYLHATAFLRGYHGAISIPTHREAPPGGHGYLVETTVNGYLPHLGYVATSVQGGPQTYLADAGYEMTNFRHAAKELCDAP